MSGTGDRIEVVVLCGGRGVRLRPTTDTIPKALVPVAGKPIIDHVIGAYIAKGVRRFRLCIGYRGEQVRAHFDPPPPGLDVAFSDSGEEASMLERLDALRHEVDETFMVAYGDTFADLDLDPLLEVHRRRGALATLVTARIQNPFGIVSLEVDDLGPGGRVGSFVEKPVFDYFIGCFLMQRQALDHVDDDLRAMPDGDGLVALFSRLVDARRLAAFEHRGPNITFNTEPERRRAESVLEDFYTLREGGAEDGAP